LQSVTFAIHSLLDFRNQRNVKNNLGHCSRDSSPGFYRGNDDLSVPYPAATGLFLYYHCAIDRSPRNLSASSNSIVARWIGWFSTPSPIGRGSTLNQSRPKSNSACTGAANEYVSEPRLSFVAAL
jgi:hypothetical protein